MPNTNIYKKSLEWLEDLNQNKIVPGLERIQKIMKLLGNPQDKLRVISIGGTNAKGSTSYLSLIHISEPTRPRLIS